MARAEQCSPAIERDRSTGQRCLPALPPPGYRRRRPETTDLYEALRLHLSTWLEALDGAGDELPAHVRAEVDRFLACGVLAHGFVRVRCPRCRDDLVVAYSCKGRGFCPSCGGRQMADRAARWVDSLLPAVAWRQWVLTLPWQLRLRAAWRPTVVTTVLNRFVASVRVELRRELRRRGVRGGELAAVTAVQRFGSALNLNVHLHVLVADGLWVEGPHGVHPRFVPVRVTDATVERVVARTWRSVERWLLREGLVEPDRFDEDTDPEDATQLKLWHASANLSAATGERAGKPIRRERAPRPARPRHEPATRRRRPLHARFGGFDLHAARRVGRDDRTALERLCRYLLRPPLAVRRLTRLDDGRYRYALKAPWSDGTTALLLEPFELIERLVALVPPPKANLVRYHGVLAPNHRWRRAISPPRRADGRSWHRPELPAADKPRVPWAELLRRTFLIDVLRCERCGARRKVLWPAVPPGPIARELLAHLGLDAAPPELAPARGPPWEESWAS